MTGYHLALYATLSRSDRFERLCFAFAAACSTVMPAASPSNANDAFTSRRTALYDGRQMLRARFMRLALTPPGTLYLVWRPIIVMDFIGITPALVLPLAPVIITTTACCGCG